MRDYYKLTGCSPEATLHVLQAFAKGIEDQRIRADAEEVFRSDDRRHAYDRLNNLLGDIGELRESLGLEHADNWSARDRKEYCHGNPASSAIESLQAKLRMEAIRSAAVKPAAARTQANKEEEPNTAGCVIIGIVAFIFFIAFISQNDSSSGKSSYRAPRSSSTNNATGTYTPPKPAVPTQPMPSSGTVRWHDFAPRVAPLKIETRSGANYLLKLVDSLTGRSLMDVFIRGGDSVELEVPLGAYVIRYASGTYWYGYEHRFGSDTAYSEADDIFRFSRSGNRVNGYTITLYRVQNGNLRTETISAHEF